MTYYCTYSTFTKTATSWVEHRKKQMTVDADNIHDVPQLLREQVPNLARWKITNKPFKKSPHKK